MKKILQINVLNETGSTGRIMQNISKVLEQSGKYEVYTAYGYGKANVSNSIKIGNRFDYIVHNVCSKVFCAQGHFSKKPTRKLIEEIEKEQIDLIHLHNIHGNYLNYPLLFAYIRKRKLPVIWTLHDCWAFSGKCVYFDACNCLKWQEECKHCPILNEYPKSFFIDRVQKDYNVKKHIFSQVRNMYFVSPSEWLASNFKKSFLKNYPIYVINNGININEFFEVDSDLRKDYALDKKKVVLGVASPWSKRKGLGDFIELSKKLNDEYAIVLIGVSEKDKKMLPHNIVTISRTDSVKELAQWYSTADVFVNPTYEDNFPTVNLEALACNTPIVTYDTGGSVEVVTTETGLICKKGDIEMLKKHVEYVCNHKLDYKNCSNYIRNRLDYATVFRMYLDLYNNIFEELKM